MKKIKSFLLLIILLFLTLLIVGSISFLIIYNLGFSELTATFVSSQLSILFYALVLVKFDYKYLINSLKKKITKKVLWQTLLLTLAILLVNSSISLMLPSDFSSDTTILAATSGTIFLSVIMPVIVAPIFEELAFRVGLKHYLVDKAGLSTIFFIITSSVIFGALHWQPGELGLAIVLLTGAIGLLKSWTYIKTNNALITIGAHMIYNGLVMIIALAM